MTEFLSSNEVLTFSPGLELETSNWLFINWQTQRKPRKPTLSSCHFVLHHPHCWKPRGPHTPAAADCFLVAWIQSKVSHKIKYWPIPKESYMACPATTTYLLNLHQLDQTAEMRRFAIEIRSVESVKPRNITAKKSLRYTVQRTCVSRGALCSLYYKLQWELQSYTW